MIHKKIKGTDQTACGLKVTGDMTTVTHWKYTTCQECYRHYRQGTYNTTFKDYPDYSAYKQIKRDPVGLKVTNAEMYDLKKFKAFYYAKYKRYGNSES